ncbi:MAG: ethanolamine utilization protein EutQ [Firmicutes bacterium]|nr:ethanolamine utilization protein EutQ [Bacillota bacterium]
MIDEKTVRNIVEKVVSRELNKDLYPGQKVETSEGFEKIKDPSGILKITESTVKCEPFEQEGVSLKDVTTLREAPNMGCGIMELDHTSFEWTLTYDEYDIVLEGTLEIEIDGRVLTAHQGEIIFIPKNSHIHFQTPSFTRYVYVTYPADWQ